MQHVQVLGIHLHHSLLLLFESVLYPDDTMYYQMIWIESIND